MAPVPAELADSGHIRILIADDHPIVRYGLQTLLRTQPDFVVVGAACDGSEALRLAAALEPDILLLDLSMPGLSGLDVMREMQLEDTAPHCRTILLTAGSRSVDTATMLHFGARGVVLKDAPIELVFKSIRKVYGGELWLDRESTRAVVNNVLKTDLAPPSPPKNFGLTPREFDVIRLIVDGETNKGIAQRLVLGEDTIKHHITRIFDKTGVSNRLELALFTLHHRLLENR